MARPGRVDLFAGFKRIRVFCRTTTPDFIATVYNHDQDKQRNGNLHIFPLTMAYPFPLQYLLKILYLTPLHQP